MKYILSLLLGFFSLCHGADCGFYQAESGLLPSFGSFYCCPWSARAECAYAAGQFIGLKEGYGELGFLLAPDEMTAYQPLADLKVYWLDNGRFASSLGFGLRWWNQYTPRIWGANIFYDYRSEDVGNFNRIGLGLELLGDWLDYRLNVYLPVNSEDCSAAPIKKMKGFSRSIRNTPISASILKHACACGNGETSFSMGQPDPTTTSTRKRKQTTMLLKIPTRCKGSTSIKACLAAKRALE